jgi:hypothetical protein
VVKHLPVTASSVEVAAVAEVDYLAAETAAAMEAAYSAAEMAAAVAPLEEEAN